MFASVESTKREQTFILAGFVVFVLAFGSPAAHARDGLGLAEAVLKAINASPGADIEKAEVEKRKGRFQGAAGAFDWVVFNRAAYRQDTPAPTIDRAFDEDCRESSGSYAVGVKKKLRNGIGIIPTATAYYYENNRTEEDGEAYTNLGLDIVIPLMRGLGSRVNQAEENARRADFRAAVASLKYRIGQRVFQTAEAYWNCLARVRRLDLVQALCRQAEEDHRRTERMVARGEAGPDRLQQARERWNRRQMELARTRLALFSGRQNLLLAMGGFSSEASEPSLPRDRFPQIPSGDPLGSPLTRKRIEQLVLPLRGDYQAARIAVDAETYWLEKARDGLRPRVDLSLSPGFPDFSAGLMMEYPLHRDGARGEVLSAQARLKQAKLRQADLSDRIFSQIRLAEETLRALALQCRLADDTVLGNERELARIRRRIEVGDLNESVLTGAEESLVRAKIDRINTLSRYAVALAGYGLATGTLVEMEEEKYRLRTERLLHPIFFPGPAKGEMG